METHAPPWTLGQLAKLLNGELRGPSELKVSKPQPVDSDDPNGIAFAEEPRYVTKAEASGIGCLLLPRGLESKKPAIVVEDPRSAFGILLHWAQRPLPIAPGIHETAVVSPEATVSPRASVGPYVVIERGAKIGADTRIFPHCYVGENCEIADGCTLFPNVILYQDVSLGPRTTVHAGCVLGAEGFGYQWDGARQTKIPQIGRVGIGADVEIGALTAVDRATAGITSIGDGTKIDNFVQVAHNVKIGRDTVIAAHTGISGSSEIGDRVTVAGKVDFSHHVKVGDDIVLAGRTGVTSDIREPGSYFGLPARPLGEAMRSLMLATKLPELFSRLRKLESRVEDLEGGE